MYNSNYSSRIDSKIGREDIGQFDPQEDSDDSHALLDFFHKKLRWARVIGSLGPNNTNWYGTCIIIWNGVDLNIKRHLREPEEKEGLEGCMKVITKANRTIIGRGFLKILEHKVESRQGRICGVTKKDLTLTEWPTFSFYLPGEDPQGNFIPTKFAKPGWVVDSDLAPKLLLGNDFLNPHGANVDYTFEKATLCHLDDFSIDFQTQTRSRPCVRKVTSQKKIVLLSGQTAHIPANYKPLPNDRSFQFNAKHPAAMNSVLEAKTPRVVVVQNATPGILTISRNSTYTAEEWGRVLTRQFLLSD
ncbi:hypothetical protein B0T26DRAFT_761299 [Lasiosphaeria miniovina]|uniref:Uncharacterized protein n=1 Tax=Lasiosphaeria miniovina TaxID=1954250 RepID=A0AA40BHD8_9PEZI|nr:uncharacterized protein B0T26DRAFT_761299 [Lasiosphaeria miniovina]KAK0734260.1 hypothetical protein B0T26DRAFT_761299 [Lasiosphaeria miniovina]